MKELLKITAQELGTKPKAVRWPFSTYFLLTMLRSTEGFLWTPTYTTDGFETDAVITEYTTILQPEYDVFVICAGFSGLIADGELVKSDRTGTLRVLLEGRDRIGGRTWTAKAFDKSLKWEAHGSTGINLMRIQSFIDTTYIAL